MGENYWALLARLTDAKWWIDNRDRIGVALAGLTSLPAMTGATPQGRSKATQIRTALIAKRWGNKLPPAVAEALNRLTDADWWLDNEVGDGHPQAIDRAFGAELPDRDRNMMALPHYGPPPALHPGPCENQVEYAYARRVAFERASETGDLRIARKRESRLKDPATRCCRAKGFRTGEKEGKQVWIDKHAAEIRRTTSGLSLEQARTEARSDLHRLERNLDGWG